jgi:mono/diheme cytochrome c family protein
MKQPASTLTALTLLLASLSLPATSAAQTDQPSPPNKNSVYAELAKSPKKAAPRRNPLADDPDAVAAGSKLFGQHCAECHGEAADGGKKGPSLRAPEVQEATPGALCWLLTNGVVRKGMPVWSKLPDAQRWQLVTYIKSLGGIANQSGSAASPQ